MASDEVEQELDVLNVFPADAAAQMFHIPYWRIDGQASVSISREQQDFELHLALGDKRVDISRWSLLPQAQGDWVVEKHP